MDKHRMAPCLREISNSNTEKSAACPIPHQPVKGDSQFNADELWFILWSYQTFQQVLTVSHKRWHDQLQLYNGKFGCHGLSNLGRLHSRSSLTPPSTLLLWATVQPIQESDKEQVPYHKHHNQLLVCFMTMNDLWAMVRHKVVTVSVQMWRCWGVIPQHSVHIR